MVCFSNIYSSVIKVGRLVCFRRRTRTVETRVYARFIFYSAYLRNHWLHYSLQVRYVCVFKHIGGILTNFDKILLHNVEIKKFTFVLNVLL